MLTLFGWISSRLTKGSRLRITVKCRALSGFSMKPRNPRRNFWEAKNPWHCEWCLLTTSWVWFWGWVDGFPPWSSVSSTTQIINIRFVVYKRVYLWDGMQFTAVLFRGFHLQPYLKQLTVLWNLSVNTFWYWFTKP